jgi:hypothetical protein
VSSSADYGLYLQALRHYAESGSQWFMNALTPIKKANTSMKKNCDRASRNPDKSR